MVVQTNPKKFVKNFVTKTQDLNIFEKTIMELPRQDNLD